MALQNLPTDGRAAIETALREALRQTITDNVPAAANTFTRRIDTRVKEKWEQKTSYTDPVTGRQTLRALFILFGGITGKPVPETCHTGTLYFRIRGIEQFYDGTDEDNSNDAFITMMLDVIDALDANSSLGYRNCRMLSAEIVDEPLLDPFDTGFGAYAHRADIEVEVRVN